MTFLLSSLLLFFFLNNRAPPEISPLPLHDALPFWSSPAGVAGIGGPITAAAWCATAGARRSRCRGSVAVASSDARSEEHTSELQSRLHLVCRLLLEKKKHQRIARARAFVKNTAIII